MDYTTGTGAIIETESRPDTGHMKQYHEGFISKTVRLHPKDEKEKKENA